MSAITAGFRWAAARKRSRDPIVVRLVSDREPTPERWRAFGWTVKVPPAPDNPNTG